MKTSGKTALLAALLGLCAGGLVVLLWYLAAGPWNLVPFSFVDGSFFTGLVLLLLALMGLTKGGAGRNTNAGVSQSHNFGVSVAYATDLKIKNNGKQRERRGPTLWEAGLALLGAALACLLPFILSLLF